MEQKRQVLGSPRKFEPKIRLSDQTQLALRHLVKPHIGKRLPKSKCRAIAQMVMDAHPTHVVVAWDVTSSLDKTLRTVSILLVVDGEQDQGLVFGFTKADGSIWGNPANDA